MKTIEEITNKIEYFDRKVRLAQKGTDEHSKKLVIRWSAKREVLKWVLN